MGATVWRAHGTQPVWRLVRSGELDGPTNMALDEAIFENVADGCSPPTLRLYSWQPPTVSLGRFQPLDERIDLAEIEARQYGLVRRPTGGRAILHDCELTYLVAVREEDLAHGHSLAGSYREISRGLEAGLRELGLAPVMGPLDGQERPSYGPKPPAFCFARAARCDLTAAGRKIVGSAQMRTRGAILQHGSIPIRLCAADVLAVMPGGSGGEASRLLVTRAFGVADALGRDISREELEAAVIRGFEAALAVAFELGNPTPAEEARAAELACHKYRQEAWTHAGTLPPASVQGSGGRVQVPGA